MEKSQEINELAGALSKAQGQIHGAKKDSDNPFFKSKYADLESVWEAIRDPLTQNGLSVSQVVENMNLTTILMHVSGQYLQGSYLLTPKDNSPQAIGSAISYARRYALASIVGVYQVDDDAEHAQARHVQSKSAPQQQQQRPPPQQESNNSKFASKEQVAEIYAIGRKKKFSDADIFKIIKNVAGDVKSSHEIPSMAVGIIYSFLEKNEPGDVK